MLPHQLGREAAVIRLQDRWGSFVRDLILTSYVGNVVTASGNPIPKLMPGLRKATALDHLRITFTGRTKKLPWWEPNWYDAAEAIDAATRLQIGNLAEISAGIGLTPSPLDELRAARNYVAHKNKQSVEKIAPHLRAHPSRASLHAYLQAPVVGGVSRFAAWCIQLDQMALLAVA
jgi:hypothetical protein